MKRAIMTGLSALLISATAAVAPSPARAEVTGATPFQLTYLAYQGHLVDEGIPSYGRLVNELRSQAVTVDEVLTAGVAANRISADALDDPGYRQALRIQLRRLEDNDNGI